MKKYILFIIGLTLLISELILSVNTVLGFIFYSMLITGCLIALSRPLNLDHRGKLIIVLLILPTMRMIELFIPFSYVYRTIIAYCILFFLIMFYAFRFKVDLGHTKQGLVMLPLTIILGAVIGIVGGLLFPIQKYHELLLFLPMVAFAEEGLFRGLIQNLMWDNYGTTASIVFTSLLYAIFSISIDFSLGFGFFFFMFAANLLICFIYNRQGNIWLTIPINLLMNIFLFALHRV